MKGRNWEVEEEDKMWAAIRMDPINVWQPASQGKAATRGGGGLTQRKG